MRLKLSCAQLSPKSEWKEKLDRENNVWERRRLLSINTYTHTRARKRTYMCIACTNTRFWMRLNFNENLIESNRIWALFTMFHLNHMYISLPLFKGIRRLIDANLHRSTKRKTYQQQQQTTKKQSHQQQTIEGIESEQSSSLTDHIPRTSVSGCVLLFKCNHLNPNNSISHTLGLICRWCWCEWFVGWHH